MMVTAKCAVSEVDNIDTPEAGRVALKFFFGLMEHWNCTPNQQRLLLGSISTTTFYKYKRQPAVRLSHDTLERISNLMGIYKTLSIIFGNSRERAYTWVSRENTAAPFNGQTVLKYMLAGRVVDIADVRRYLDGCEVDALDSTLIQRFTHTSASAVDSELSAALLSSSCDDEGVDTSS